MTQKNKPVGKKHIIVLVILSLLFIIILFLSTALKDISQTYEFKENIETKNFNSFMIGTVIISNNGPITAKDNFKNLIGCVDGEEVYISYVNSDLDSINKYYQETFEISSKETENVKIYTDYFHEKLNKDDTLSQVNLSIYELGENTRGYNFCVGANKDTAISNIKINISNN
ncbi:MAG: hypothetical protein HRU03_08170 [Nanoarchaeales archaeon]|nr:hypothetical protein [Nanoarchaeales archaeon]